MSVAIISLIALLIAIVVSCFLPYNVGLLSIAFAFLVGVLFAGMKASAILSGFPTSLFIILVGVTYLFSIAEVNGTLERMSNTCIRLVRGKRSLVPIVFFVLGFFLSAIGPGAIPVTALLAPPAMALASKMKINPFLMALFVANGANAAALSPITPSGAIAVGILKNLGRPDISWELFRNTAIANVVIQIFAYFAFGGLALLRPSNDAVGNSNLSTTIVALSYERKHVLTLVGIAMLLLGTLVLKYDVGLLGIVIGVILTILGCAEEGKVIKSMPWGVILMVCGVTVLVNLMSKTGGMDMAVKAMATISTPNTLTFTATFIPGIVSAYASSTGVVLPAFLPLVDGLVKAVGADFTSVFSGVCLGAFIVDASPLSTLGALMLGAATPEMDKRKLFNQLMIWGLSMSVVGAVVAWIIF